MNKFFVTHKKLKISSLAIFSLVLIIENTLGILKTSDWQLKNTIALILGNLLIFITAAYLIFLFKTAKNLNQLSSDKVAKYYKWSLIILSLALLIVPFFFIVHVPHSKHDWDFFVIYRDTNLLQGQTFDHLPMTENERLYFLRYPNNQFFGIVYNFVFAALSKIMPKIIALTAVAAIFTSVSLIAGSLLVKKIADKKMGLLFNLVAFGFLPLYVYGAEFYTDTASLPFVIGGLLFIVYAIKAEKMSRQILWWTFASLVIFIGYYIKPTVAFSLIAAMLFLLLNRKWKKLMLAVPITLLLFVGVHEGVKTIIASDPAFTAKANDRYNLPLIHWVTMSFAPGNKSGGFDPNVLAYSEGFTSKAAKQTADLQLLEVNLKQQGVTGFLVQLGRKISYTWFNGDLRDFFYTYRHANPLVSRYFDWVSTKNPEDNATGWFLLNGAQTLYWIALVFFMWYGIFLSLFKKWKSVWFILGLSMLALTGFLLVWEANSRYLYNFAPIFLALATMGGINFLNGTEKKKKV